MEKTVEIKLSEVVKAFKLMEEINHFIHQPRNYDRTDKFADKYNEEIRAMYYDIMWHWLPEDVQEKLMEE